MKIVHLHGFKCAGSTFSWILQNLYGEKLLYVESKNGNQRLSWKSVELELDLNEYTSITSHTLEYPADVDDEYFFVEFVRNPIDRLKSAYVFQKKVGDISQNTTFSQYCLDHAGSTRENFMTRRLSPQTFDNPNRWSISDDFVPVSAENLFVGSVEFFDESLVLLETILSNRFSFSVNLAYPMPKNVQSSSKSKIHFDNINDSQMLSIMDRDLVLSSKVNSLILTLISEIPDFKDRLSNFHDRCKLMREQDLSDVVLKTKKQWIKL